VRGVGGQGNLFVGKALAEVARLAGFENVVKGETHGMAQLGGAVMSTFACGDVHSSVLAPGSADVLLALECSEVLRPGFLELLKPGGIVVLNRLRIIPAGMDQEAYPSLDRIRECLRGIRTVEFDGLKESRTIGDQLGKAVNVIALGILSSLDPFSRIPLARWQEGLAHVSPSENLRQANRAAFSLGRGIFARDGA